MTTTANTSMGETPKPNGKWRLYGAGTLTLLALLALLFWLFSGGVSEDIRTLLVQSRDYYEEKHDNIPTLANSLETPADALSFVREKISVSVYEGRLQSAEEVLRTRVANPADKAMFLKALLKEMGVKTTAKASGFPDEARAYLVITNETAERSAPEALRKLMAKIGYDGSDAETHVKNQLALVSANLEESRELVNAAGERVKSLIHLQGQSSANQAYLDWVWLEDAQGNIFDPVLPENNRPEAYRIYSESPTKSRFSINAVNAYGEIKEMVTWEGAAYGKPVSVSFVPAIDTANRLDGNPDMSDVEVWAPVLSVGNDHILGAAVNREGDVAPKALIEELISQGKTPEFSAPNVNNLEIRSVDTSQWPRVKLTLAASVEGTPLWHGSHFSLSMDDASPPIRIEQAFSARKNVIILADQSGSTLENDHHAWIKKFGSTLASGLSTKQRFAVATYGYQPVFHKLFQPGEPQYYQKTAYGKAWEQPVRGQVDFTTALEHALYAILVELGENPDQQTEIILVTDGKSGKLIDEEWTAKLSEIRERVNQLNASITPVVVGTSEDTDLEKLAYETGGKLIRITGLGSVAGQANALAKELAGGMVISFKAPSTLKVVKGDTLPFDLQLEGFDGIAKARLTVPETIRPHEPGIYLNINSGRNSTSRPLILLGDNYRFQRMLGQYRVYLSAGRYNANQLIAGRLNNWITYYDIKAGNEEALQEAAKVRRVSVAQMQTVNGLTNAVEFGLPVDQSLRFPLVMVRRTYGEEPGNGNEGKVAIINDLDVPAWLPLTANTAAKEEVAQAGLLLNDAEARFNGNGENLTRKLAEAPEINEQAEPNSARELLFNSSLKVGGDSRLFTHAAIDNLFWHARENTGQWHGFGLWDNIPLKGSRDVEIAARFSDIQTAIGMYNYSAGKSAELGAALAGIEATAAAPAAVALGGFIAFKSEELKLWCFSTIMLGYVNESIAGEQDAILDKSPQAAQSRAASLCNMKGGPQDFGKNAFKAAAKAFFDTWANQHEIPQAEDPTAGLRNAYDRASRVYKHYFPNVKKGEKPPSKDRYKMFIGAVDKVVNGDGPSLQSQLVDKGFEWGWSSFSPSFRSDLANAIGEEIK